MNAPAKRPTKDETVYTITQARALARLALARLEADTGADGDVVAALDVLDELLGQALDEVDALADKPERSRNADDVHDGARLSDQEWAEVLGERWVEDFKAALRAVRQDERDAAKRGTP